MLFMAKILSFCCNFHFHPGITRTYDRSDVFPLSPLPVEIFIHQAQRTRIAEFAPTPVQRGLPISTQNTQTPTQPSNQTPKNSQTPAQLTHPFIYFMFCLHCRLVQPKQQPILYGEGKSVGKAM